LPVVAPSVLAVPIIPVIPAIPDFAVRTLIDAIVSLEAFWPLNTVGAFAFYAIRAFALYPLNSILSLWAFWAVWAVLAIVTALDALARFAAIPLIVGAVDRLCVTRLAIVVRRRRFCAGVALRHLVGLI